MKTLRARIVLPVSSSPIEDGAVRVEGSQIVEVGRWQDLKSEDAEDLGEVVLMPGLINAHCHLDYSSMRNAIMPTSNFSQWVRRINELKRILSDDEYLAAIASGFQELRRWGATSVFNIKAFPELMVRMPKPLIRTWWFYELLDIRTRIHTDDVVAGALAFFEGRQDWVGGFGLSPHAPYTTSLGLYELCRDCCIDYGMPLMTHLAETEEEYAMFKKGEGPLYEFLKGIGRDMSDTGRLTPFQHLVENNALPKGAILTHMNVLSEEDWELLARRKEEFSIVHCPNCHIYFQRGPFDLERFLSVGVNLCLGTDSLASNKALNMFEEMRTVRDLYPGVPLEKIVEMVTVNPAKAIGSAGKLGEICPGAWADLIAVPYAGSVSDVASGVIDNRAPVEWLTVQGQLVPLD